MKRCKYCAEGNEPDESGEHWIVQSINPAKIKIVACALKARTPAHGEEG